MNKQCNGPITSCKSIVWSRLTALWIPPQSCCGHHRRCLPCHHWLWYYKDLGTPIALSDIHSHWLYNRSQVSISSHVKYLKEPAVISQSQHANKITPNGVPVRVQLGRIQRELNGLNNLSISMDTARQALADFGHCKSCAGWSAYNWHWPSSRQWQRCFTY